MHVFVGVAKNKVRGVSKICTLQRKEICCALQWGKKLPGHHLLQQGLMKINLSCPDFSCVWCIVYDESDRMLNVSLSRPHSFMMLGLCWLEGFDIIKEPHGHDGDLERGTLYRISPSLALWFSLSLSRSVSLLFIYLTVHETAEDKKIERGKAQSVFSWQKLPYIWITRLRSYSVNGTSPLHSFNIQKV